MSAVLERVLNSRASNAVRRRRAEEALRRQAQEWRGHRQLERVFQTRRSAAEPFRFAVLGDAEPGRFWIFRKLFSAPGIFSRQLGSLGAHSLDFIMQLGDMVSRGTPENYRKLLDILSANPPQAPYLTVIGNHDRSRPNGRSNSRLYKELFGRRTNYFFDHGDVRFIVLDSSRASLSQAQLRWLDLALETPLKKIVFTHMPPLSLRLCRDLPLAARGGFKAGSEEFIRLMSRHRVDRVYCGHIHAFAVRDHEGARYILSGGGGSPLFPSGIADTFYHYLVVSVSSAGIRERVYLLDGTSFEIPPGKVLPPKTASF